MNSGFFNWKTIIVGTLAVLALFSGLQMMRSPDRILNDILVEEEGGRLVLQVKFNIPIRYEAHMPQRRGSLVQIKVRPVSFSDTAKNEYLGSESILPGFMAKVPITDVAYEGDVPGGPILTLRFSQPVSYEIKENEDFSSIILHLSAAS